jgi:DNA polymerase elongation subunit (family B)
MQVEIIIPGSLPVKRGRPPINEIAMTKKQSDYKYNSVKRKLRLQHIAVLDMETDPFDDAQGEIHPFCAELYSDQFGSIVIWDNDHETLINKLVTAIEALPDRYTIYAHNGGKFDYMFLVHKLRGTVRFKGRAIMSARIGAHELRDSLHILPEKLAAWKKDKFDYSKMARKHRHKFRDEILKYLHSDCVYLFDFIKRFTQEFGLKISIGQAAFSELKKHYKITPIKETMDHALRPYFLGGRVECIGGSGLFESAKRQKPFVLYDVNSMYPYVMATHHHPVSPNYLWRRGEPSYDTCFIDLSCQSYGAMFTRKDTGELSADTAFGRFHTTIWEYRTALKYKLIENVEIHWCIDNADRTDFSKFIVPMYNRRQETKTLMDQLKRADKEQTTDYEELKKEGIFLKYLLNNSYGKCAQNPRKYREYYYADHGTRPPKDWFDFLPAMNEDQKHEFSFPVERCSDFDVWAKPSPGRTYNNVGTAASITGAARAILLEAIENATDPIYCDTDSLICRDLRTDNIDVARLGAWKIENTFDNVIITGKKTYCCQIAGKPDCTEGHLLVRSKGVDLRVRPDCPEPTAEQWQTANAQTWQKYLEILDGQVITTTNKAPTFNKLGQQHYLTRRIRATAPQRARQFGNGKALRA